MSTTPRRVYAALVAVQVLFGLHYIATAYGVDHVPALTWSAIRICLGAFLLVALFRSQIWRWPRGVGPWTTLLKLAVLGVGINQGAFALGLVYTTPTHAALINAMIPVLTLGLALLKGQERVRPRRVAALLISLTGALVLLEVERFDPSSDTVLGDLLILTNAVSFALFLILSKPVMEQANRAYERARQRKREALPKGLKEKAASVSAEGAKTAERAHLDPVTEGGPEYPIVAGPLGLTALVMVAGAPLLLVISAPQATTLSLQDWAEMPGWIWLALAFVVVGATVGTYSLNYYALAQVDSSKVALFIYLQPLVAGLISIGLGDEELTLRLVVAGLLICLGVGLTVKPKRSVRSSAET